MFPLQVIRNDAEYQGALATLHALTESEADGELSPTQINHLEVLTLLVHQYEQQTSPVPPPDPIAAIRARMQERGLRQRDLVALMGTESTVSEELAGKRRFTVQMIRNLSQALDIPVEILLQQA